MIEFLKSLNPIYSWGYQFWSGIGGAIVGPALLGLVIYLTPDVCEQIGCYRRARIAHLESGLKLCRRHVPEEKLEAVEREVLNS